ncbi:hypothetical protein D9758_000319 [Tetrapyrgos nigripes]|uniref:Uncharacterized protein n=1 Tax=Tetrapyrgos nigripes TaxID=182062 RepID=A0A8H5LZ59_9AGAR|nr:hypothetical protein D9758_000319 [Tetrapyrgos nigripes]
MPRSSHRSQSSLVPATPTFNDESDSDIYRGERPPTFLQPEDPTHPDSSSTTSSSSSWSFFAGRLGVLRVVHQVEHAIMRWRGNASSSSLTSSSSSSSSHSVMTLSRSLSRRGARRSSLANIRSLQSERDFTARISLLKAREESRVIPRQFILYLPSALRPTSTFESPAGPSSQGTIWTSSLPLVLSQLDGALKKVKRSRRSQEKEKAAPAVPTATPNPELHHHIMLPETLKAPSRAASFTDLEKLNKVKKGKGKDASGRIDIKESFGAWHLDVASPNPEDMRAIGKLLHLHPLTLEDILTQDPREKLELFPKLGYYFISFRAVEGRQFREKLTSQAYYNDPASEAYLENSLLAEANIYIVVFNEGICTFHFTDISEHTDRVRSRITSNEKSMKVSSAWIAHGLLDSIVDSFFPISDEIELEIMAIEEIIMSGKNPVAAATRNENTAQEETSSLTLSKEEEFLATLTEKNLSRFTQDNVAQTRFSLPRPPLPLLYRRALRFLRSRRKTSRKDKENILNYGGVTLRRMAKARRLVTSLTRLLATKSEVISQVRKRLLSAAEDVDVAIYMGDIHGQYPYPTEELVVTRHY